MELVVNATPLPLYPRERPSTHCIGGWVGPRAGLDGCGKSRPPSGFDPRTVQPVAEVNTVPLGMCHSAQALAFQSTSHSFSQVASVWWYLIIPSPYSKCTFPNRFSYTKLVYVFPFSLILATC